MNSAFYDFFSLILCTADLAVVFPENWFCSGFDVGDIYLHSSIFVSQQFSGSAVPNTFFTVFCMGYGRLWTKMLCFSIFSGHVFEDQKSFNRSASASIRAILIPAVLDRGDLGHPLSLLGMLCAFRQESECQKTVQGWNFLQPSPSGQAADVPAHPARLKRVVQLPGNAACPEREHETTSTSAVFLRPLSSLSRSLRIPNLLLLPRDTHWLW